MKTVLLRTLLLAGAFVAAGGCKGSKEKVDDKDAPISVQVMKVEPESITRVLTYDADVQGELEVKVFAQVPERILSLPVDEGATVKKGQVLAVLRSESLSEGVRSTLAAVDAAKADRDNLKTELERAEKLVAKNIVSRAQVDQFRARLLSAEAQIRRLEAMSSQASTAASYATVRSPIDGIVGRRFLSQGDLAAVSLPILTVVRMDRVELMLEVPERELTHVREGMAARIRVARYADQDFSGEVVLLAPTIDRQTRTARVKLRAPNAEHRLMPGMLAKVSLEVEWHKGVAVVPYSSLIIEAATEGRIAYRTFIVSGTLARERHVELGIVDGDRVELLGGVSFGELMVTKGQHLLTDGQKVNVVEQETAKGASQSPIPAKESEVTKESPAPSGRGGNP
jgi:membrane fusion protein, multidrug efflux system